MVSTARSMPPNLKRAVDREHEDETVVDWLRRQQHPTRKPIPTRGITQAAPKKTTTPVAPDAVKNTNEETNHV